MKDSIHLAVAMLLSTAACAPAAMTGRAPDSLSSIAPPRRSLAVVPLALRPVRLDSMPSGSVEGDARATGAPLSTSTPAPADAGDAASEPEARPRSERLPSGFSNPMPGGVLAGYRADTGLDIAGSPRPVFAIASGTLDYSEPGHSLWVGPRDTANAVRIELDSPIMWRGRRITHVWYAHLSALRFAQPEGAERRIHVEAGEELGTSGIARGSPHLHLGFLLDGIVTQEWGSFLLEDEIRAVIGPYSSRARLPGMLAPRPGRVSDRSEPRTRGASAAPPPAPPPALSPAL